MCTINKVKGHVYIYIYVKNENVLDKKIVTYYKLNLCLSINSSHTQINEINCAHQFNQPYKVFFYLM